MVLDEKAIDRVMKLLNEKIRLREKEIYEELAKIRIDKYDSRVLLENLENNGILRLSRGRVYKFRQKR